MKKTSALALAVLLTACAGVEVDSTPTVEPTVAPTATPATLLTATPRLAATPRPTRAPLPTVTPTPTPNPDILPTVIPGIQVFDYAKLLPQREPKPPWQVAVERWRTLEWFEGNCANGVVFELAGKTGAEIAGKGNLSAVSIAMEPFPGEEYKPISYTGYRPRKGPLAGIDPSGVIEMPGWNFGTFSVYCMYVDKHIALQPVTARDVADAEKVKVTPFTDELALILVHGDTADYIWWRMKCLDGSNSCGQGRVWTVYITPPTDQQIIKWSAK